MIGRSASTNAHLYVLTPYPGTAFYDGLEAQGRLLEHKDRSH